MTENTKQPYRFEEQTGSMVEIKYKSGGNPPRLPALWMGKLRIAWWPAGYAPTPMRVEKVYYEWREKGEVLGRDEVLVLITE